MAIQRYGNPRYSFGYQEDSDYVLFADHQAAILEAMKNAETVTLNQVMNRLSMVADSLSGLNVMEFEPGMIRAINLVREMIERPTLNQEEQDKADQKHYSQMMD